MEDVNCFVKNPDLTLLEMKEIIKKDDFFVKIIGYINGTLFPNSMIHEEVIRNFFFNELCNIITNFNKFIGINIGFQTGEIKLPQLVNIDLENEWFAGEKSFINDLSAENHFAINPLKSQMVTIVCKLVDFANTNFISEIKLLDDLINNPTRHHYPLTELIRHKAECIAKFKDFHTLSNTIHKYFLLILDKNNKCYLSFLPRSIMNIFSSSLMFIDDDLSFLSFIVNSVKMYQWIPSEYRCIYITKIIKLIQKNKFPNIIRKFNPDICLLIDDINTMYKKYLREKDQDVFQNMILLSNVLSNLLSNLLISDKKCDINGNIDKLIYFISIQLTIISKIKSEKEHIPLENYHTLIANSCICIKYIIYHDLNVINSYLVHYIPNILLDYCNENDNEVISALIHDIFILLLENNTKVKIYLCSQDDENKLSQLKILLGESASCYLHEWMHYYVKIKDYELYDKLLDPITSCIIVNPCVIPMNEDGTMFQICDKYMMMTYLWTTPTNPFTRCDLSIDDLEEFNKLEHCVKAVSDFNDKLKDGIAFAKKIKIE